jgi:hypothetical protein
VEQRLAGTHAAQRNRHCFVQVFGRHVDAHPLQQVTHAAPLAGRRIGDDRGMGISLAFLTGFEGIEHGHLACG